MANFYYIYHYHMIILFFVLLSQHSDCHLTSQLFINNVFGEFSRSPNDLEGTKWAVLVAGSRGFRNYRHQADICHAYQILKRGGLKDENIIVFMYDDIALHKNNPRKGTIINNPKGEDVYKGVPKDYTGDNLTTTNLLAAILGNKTAIQGGSGKVVNSGPNDRIFIYYSDHGSPGLLSMPNDDDMYAKDFIDTLKNKYESRTYKSMVIYVEACEAGSIFGGFLEKKWNIYVTTASNSYEKSWATYCPIFDDTSNFPSGYDTCLGDLYSASWMEDSEMHNTQSETLKEQYQVIKKRTISNGFEGSHVMKYGNIDISTDHLSLYFGSSTTNSSLKHQNNRTSNNASPNQLSSFTVVDQHEADILYLKRKVLQVPIGSKKRKEYQEELDDALSHRNHIDNIFHEIGKGVFGDEKGYEMNKTFRSTGHPIVDDWDCFKTLVETYKTYCGTLSTYGKKHLRVFANMCNAAVQPSQVEKVTSKVCGNKLK